MDHLDIDFVATKDINMFIGLIFSDLYLELTTTCMLNVMRGKPFYLLPVLIFFTWFCLTFSFS